MRKRLALALYSMFTIVAVAACVPIVENEYAEVCDDTKDANCAPDRKVIVEE